MSSGSVTTTTTKRDWHHQVEHERIPANEVHETPDGKTIRIEYREENGTIYKTTKTYRNQKLKVLPIVAERKKWKKFGNAASDPPGINTATTKVDDEITMQFISNKEDDKQDEEKLIKEAVSTLRKVQCRLCKGEHWTTKCPYKDNLQSITDSYAEKQNENVTATANKPPSQGQSATNGPAGDASTGGKWVSQRVRDRTGPGTAYPGDRGGSTRGGSYSGRTMDRKQDEATVRVTNLPEETQEQDLRDLFTPFGPVSRVFLAKDKTSNTSKGFAFITFNEKKDAQKAIECVSGFGYDHLILKVEWANKPQNQ
jgi:translation initiation factor 3 subunit G